MAPSYRTAVVMIIVGGALLSLLGIGMRVMEGASSYQILFYRALSSAIFLSLVLLVRDFRAPSKAFLSLGSRGLLAACLLAFASLFMVLAVANTSVANAVFIVSLAPLSSAILGRVILQEQVARSTWVAIGVAVVGICIIFADGLSGGGLLGMFFAFVMMLMYSGSLITVRSQSGADMLAIAAVSGAILALGISPFVESFSLSRFDLILCIALGVVQISLGMVLIITGAQSVPTAQVSLLALLEVVLSPLWVWIGVGEVPSIYSLIGGVIVIVGVVMQALAAVPRDEQSSRLA